jgi:hypothetical protein
MAEVKEKVRNAEGRTPKSANKNTNWYEWYVGIKINVHTGDGEEGKQEE